MVKYNLDLSGKTIVVTGSSGFIGSNLCLKLMEEWPDAKIIGIDNMNHYYDIRLKELRLQKLVKNPQFTFILGDISDKDTIDRVFADYKPQIIVNLAAQAGVRWSLVHPEDYIKSNIVGFYNILEASRHSYDGLAEEEKAVPVSAQDYAKGVYHGVEHLVYASSSSVYGGNVKYPFSTDDPVDTPVSLYAAPKKSAELIAYAPDDTELERLPMYIGNNGFEARSRFEEGTCTFEAVVTGNSLEKTSGRVGPIRFVTPEQPAATPTPAPTPVPTPTPNTAPTASARTVQKTVLIWPVAGEVSSISIKVPIKSMQSAGAVTMS